jgi:hypothetical protein
VTKHSELSLRPPNASVVLRRVLAAPGILATLQLSEWDRFLPEARSAGLLPRLDFMLTELGLFDSIPDPVKPHLIAARRIADNEHSVICWEVNRIARALAGVDARVVLLKGAAYVLQGLRVARGRISSDVDILVSKDALKTVESALLYHGWQQMKLDDYDQYFYRKWSHELPPLQHRDRGTVVDVHHTILPPTGRLHPDPEKLLAASVPLGESRFYVLAPADMVLHSAAHAFQDGDLTRGLRDLVDIDDLLRQFSRNEEFWDKLSSRAEALQLFRPLYYALRYANLYLQTPIPQNIINRSQRWKPPWPACSAMDLIVDQAVTAGPWHKDLGLRLSRKLLYVRAHWLRMPPYLLIPHLIRKAMMNRTAGIEH